MNISFNALRLSTVLSVLQATRPSSSACFMVRTISFCTSCQSMSSPPSFESKQVSRSLSKKNTAWLDQSSPRCSQANENKPVKVRNTSRLGPSTTDFWLIMLRSIH
jgi:hypothetical protein